MPAKRSHYTGMLWLLAGTIVLRGQERPLTASGTFFSGYYSTVTKGEARQSLSFIPAGARFELGGYLLSPDLLSVQARPELTFGPQATEAGIQGGNGIQLGVTLLRRSIVPLTFRYSNLQSEDAYFGSLSRLSGYTLKNRAKELGVTLEFKPRGLPASTLDWGSGSANSTSGSGAVSDYQANGDHLNADSKYARGGWNLEGFFHRHRQRSNLLAPFDGGTRTGSLRETGVQYQGSARRSLFHSSELYVDGGEQRTSSLLFTLPVELSTRYANADLKLLQRRRWKSSLRARYSSNLSSQMLEQAASALAGPGAVVPDGNILAPFSRSMGSLNLGFATSFALGAGFDLFGNAERTAVLSSSQNSLLNSRYLTASAGLTYGKKFHWGSYSGEYARELGSGSLTGRTGTIRGQRYMASVQRGRPDSLRLDGVVRGSDQRIQTAQPLSNRSYSAEGSVADRIAGGFSARLGGGWQWGSIVNSANEFRTKGYTARAGIEHSRIQIGAALGNSLSNSLPFYGQMLGGFGTAPVALDLRVVPSDYRSLSLTLHANPLRKIEVSAAWTRSRQHLDGLLSNDFEILNAYVTYHFRKLQFEAGFIRSNQRLLEFPAALRARAYFRVQRTVKFL